MALEFQKFDPSRPSENSFSEVFFEHISSCIFWSIHDNLLSNVVFRFLLS